MAQEIGTDFYRGIRGTPAIRYSNGIYIQKIACGPRKKTKLAQINRSNGGVQEPQQAQARLWPYRNIPVFKPQAHQLVS